LTDTAREPIAGKVVRATAWTLGGYGTSQTLRFVGNLILTRLMNPDVFGLASLVLTFIYGLQMFTDVGTGPAVVQSPHGDKADFLDTAWTIQCIRGGFLFMASCAIAFPVAWFYNQPMLAWLVPAAGLGAVFDGFASMSLHSASRHLRVQWLTFIEITTQALNILTIIVLALVLRRVFGAGDLRLVWATIAGTVVGELTRMVLSHAVVPGIRHRFLLDPQSRKVLFSFGRWVFFSTLLMFLATQSDRLIFAKMIPLQLLGVYGIAAALGNLPAQAVQRMSSAVLFPAYSRRQGREDFHRIFWRARLPVLLAGATLVSGLAACGPFLVRVLYDTRYVQAGPILQVLAVAAWFQMLEATNGAALLAVGKVRWMAWGNAAKLVAMLVLLPLGFHLGGFQGALVGLVLSDVLKYVTSAIGAAGSGLGGLGMDAFLSFVTAAVAVAGFFVGAAAAVGRFPQLAGFLVSGTLAAIFWAVVGLWYWRRRRTEETANP
jgi:O-antigen/teichoic acid export membrane protein